jgi:hypothetical protein
MKEAGPCSETYGNIVSCCLLSGHNFRTITLRICCVTHTLGPDVVDRAQIEL